MEETIKTGFLLDGVEYQNPVLTFSSEKYAEKANRQISFAIALDMRETVIWDEPKKCGTTSRYYINHPVTQVGIDKIDEVMEFVDAETVEEMNPIWVPVVAQ